uniref:E3 ubiquitin-protein ligase RBBP6 n=1 Tax=Panagrolaimus superbus TaxID=310955 RepID=A0A914YD09_9BILA
MTSGTSSIHYKFGNDVELKRLPFEGIHISLDELKKAISQVEGINLEYVDLSLKNADTKRVYEGSCFIPRNSTVILMRVPRATPVRMPKVNGSEASGAILLKPVDRTPVITHINQDIFAKMSEEERLKHVKMISTLKYNPINYNRKCHVFQNGTVPADFRCHRCSNLGHHPKQCPMVIVELISCEQNVRKTTGIPSEELMDVDPDDPNALLHQSGRYVMPILHYKARETRKLVDKALLEREKQLANNKDFTTTVDEKLSVPQELECPLCHRLLLDALLAPCCGESFCAECIQNYMLKCSENEEGARCPTCPISKPLSVDSLIVNKRIRDAVQRHKTSIITTVKVPGGIPLAAVPVAAHNLSPKFDPSSPTRANDISNSQSPPSTQIIQLPTVNLTTSTVANTIVTPPSINQIIVDFTKPPPNFKPNTPSPSLNDSKSTSNSPALENGALENEIECPPGTTPIISTTLLNHNFTSSPTNHTSLSQPMNSMNFNRPQMANYYNPATGMMVAGPMIFNGATSTTLSRQHSNNGMNYSNSSSNMDCAPGTEVNMYQYERIDRDDKCFERRKQSDDNDRRHRKYDHDIRARRRSRSPYEKRASRHDRDKREKEKDRDEKKLRKNPDRDEGRSSRRHKEDSRHHEKSSHRHRKNKEDDETKHKKKSTKKEKKKKKDHSN